MVPLLKFYFHEEVRQAAVQSLPDLLSSAIKAAEKGQQGATPGHAKQLLDYMWGPLIEAMNKVLRTHLSHSVAP
jgi:importin-5